MMGQDLDLPEYARRAARLLATPERDSGVAELGQRKQAVEVLGAALRTRSRQRRQRRRLLAAGAAAVVLLAAGLLATSSRTPVPVARVEGGEALQAGGVVRATGGRSVGVALRTGTRLHLTDGGRLGLAELGSRQRFVLQAGRVWAKVAPLAPGQGFVVATADAEVEVRGTVFEVSVVPPRSECDGAATEVRVLEGLVTVRRNGRQWQIPAGQHWPGDCRPPVAAAAPAGGATAAIASGPARPVEERIAAPVRRSTPASPAPRARPPAAAQTSPPPASTPAASTLAEQNELFAGAMDARRRGDVAEARRRLDELLARFPFGALADSARRESAKLPRAGGAPRTP
jgi:hypothetical protein